MFRSAGLALTLLAGSVAAGELTDCFNDEIDLDARLTSAEPEVLRVTDADIGEMLRRIREAEKPAVADRGGDASPRVSLVAEAPPPD